VSDGWAVGPGSPPTRAFAPPAVLEHTSDGGHTWGAVKDPCGLDELTSVSFPTVADGFVLCTGEPGAGMQGKAVFATTDGGHTWKVAAQVQIGKQTPALGSGGYAHGIVFRDPTHGYMLLGGGAGGGGVLRSTDGGATWVGLGGRPFAEYVDALAFPTADVGYVAQGSLQSTDLYRTADGGTTWTEVWPSPALVPTGGQLLAGGGIAYGIGPAGGLVRSTDGGATWSAVGADPAALSSIAGSQTLFGVKAASGGTDDLYVSADGGRKWVSLPLPASVSPPYALGFDSRADGLVEARGGLFHTADGGRSFVLVNASPPLIGSLDAVAPADAWAIGPRSLRHSTDGGVHWQAYRDPGGAPPQFVSFTDAEHGMVLSGDYGNCGGTDCTSTLLTTADGGRTWNARLLPGVLATALAMTAPGHALLLTPFGLLRTSDGGAEWEWAGAREAG